ncbi:hypothetical protein Tco_1110766 [Tanacetum coccineum]|uniref:Uncharacterized protein n=1 Tax=Tanacetum coccineum TaxID=301880 RepID=A0ABQ5IJS9_9ASTR
MEKRLEIEAVIREFLPKMFPDDLPILPSPRQIEFIIDSMANSHHFIEEPIEIINREAKQRKPGRIPIVKVRCNSRRGPEFTWEREDYFMSKCPHLFSSKNTTSKKRRVSGRRVDIADCFQVLGTCDELDAFVTISDEGVMVFLRSKVNSGVAVGKHVFI